VSRAGGSEVLRAAEVAAYIEALAPVESGVPRDDNGFTYGDPDAEVRGIAVTWMPRALKPARSARPPESDRRPDGAGGGARRTRGRRLPPGVSRAVRVAPHIRRLARSRRALLSGG
jgi:hypothetical protein